MFVSAALVGVWGIIILLVLWLLFKLNKQKGDQELEKVRQDKAFSDLQLRVQELADKKFEDYKTNLLQIEQQKIVAEQTVVAEASFEKWNKRP